MLYLCLIISTLNMYTILYYLLFIFLLLFFYYYFFIIYYNYYRLMCLYNYFVIETMKNIHFYYLCIDVFLII